MKENSIIFGAAYYAEYLPCDRLEADMEMMAHAGFNTIRIAESTWSTVEPEPGRYDFSYIDRTIEAAARHGLKVIVGTPTYAVPYWLVRMDPDVLAETDTGKNRYGPRQNMDLTNPAYRRYAENVIRAVVSHTASCPNVIGFQIDNETKHYHTAGPDVLTQFRRWMAKRYSSIEELNLALGLRYWSNSVTRFEDLPDPRGTINGSYAGEFALFQRSIAEEFLLWQSGIVDAYKRPDQFITQNLDYEWKFFGPAGQQDGYSWGIQPDIDHRRAAEALTLVGTDIYCPSQDHLTGREIAFGGDLMRPLGKGRYLVLESQAQGFAEWLPYPGQLRLMAYSHLASGACGVMYWNWHSLHNGLESYWKGILSHDFRPGRVYREIAALGRELRDLAPELAGLRKKNRIAIIVSTEALHAMRFFPTDKDLSYNDVLYWVYTALYEMNLSCDILFSQEDWSGYGLLIFPELYCAEESLVCRVKEFVAKGGTVLASFRSFVADEHLKIFHDPLPHGLTDCFGLTYSQHTRPEGAAVDGAEARHWMELLEPLTAEAVARYQHRYWGGYAAVTRNVFGNGRAWYIGTMLPSEKLKEYLRQIVIDAGIALPGCQWPLVVRDCVGQDGAAVHFLLNYSSQPRELHCPWDGTDLLTGKHYQTGSALTLPDWGVCILKEWREKQ